MSDVRDKINETTKNEIVVGVSMLVRVPLILHHRKQPSQTTHKKGLKNYRKGGTVVHGKRVFQGSEAPRIVLSQHTPDQCILLHVSLTPIVTCPKVGTFGCLDHQGKIYSTSDSGSHLRHLVNCQSQRPSSHGTTSPPVQSQTKMIPDETSSSI